MSSSQFSQENEQSDADIVTLIDEIGRSLDCYIENAIEAVESTYLLLLPIDSPVVILTWDEEDEELVETVIVEDEDDLQKIFADAKAVLAELNLSLEHTAFTLTVRGELPPLEEDNILSLEIEDNDTQLDPEELQFLASFYYHEQKYSICTPIAPLLFVAKQDEDHQLELLSPDDPQLQPILEELLLEEDEEE
jgi:Protein of unknown function (DUF3727)/Protein of unknown function (DUF1292)